MTLTTSNVTSGFIDLATFDEIEKYLYGGSDATAYFVRETRKSTWFTQVPVALSRSSGEPKFGQQCSWSISRAGDYLLHSWLRATLPEITNTDFTVGDSGSLGAGSRVWCRNVGHNLIEECAITFNDLVAARFDNYHLDFWTAFTVPASKRVGYNNMIGNVSALNNPAANMIDCSKAKVDPLPEYTINVPLPLFYTRDSGVALPTAALPYNDMRITIKLRKLSELVLESSGNVIKNVNPTNFTSVDELKDVDLWCNYAIVSNDERKRMACAPRDILIEQVQTAPKQSYKTGSATRMDIRFSHAIKVLFFAVRNETVLNEWSNYESHVFKCQNVDLSGGEGVVIGDGLIVSDENSVDPIKSVSLVYENTNRLSNMGADYFSLVNPYYHAPSIPEVTGYHCYSYSLDFASLDPMGSTNYGKLTNVSLIATPPTEENAMETTGKYGMIVTAVNNNIIRVSGGALGFPVL